MEFEFSKIADSFQAGIFAILNEKKEEMVKAGKKVYNLSVGTPDFKPAPHIMEAVSEAAKEPENYKNKQQCFNYNLSQQLRQIFWRRSLSNCSSTSPLMRPPTSIRITTHAGTRN